MAVITKVGYGKQSPECGHGYPEYIFMEASVEEPEDPDTVLADLRERVNTKLGFQGRFLDLENSISQKECELGRKERELKTLEESISKARERWQKAVAFYKQFGAELENPDYDPIPF